MAKPKLYKLLILCGVLGMVSAIIIFFNHREPELVTPPLPGLQSNSTVTLNQIIVDKNAKKLFLYKDNIEHIYNIATGKNLGDKQYVGDRRTPVGKFQIVSIEKSDRWAFDFGDGKGPIVGAYGPWFLLLNTKWQGIAIHGTHDESTIGKNDTHGCVRMRNSDLIELKNLVSTGFPVEIKE